MIKKILCYFLVVSFCISLTGLVYGDIPIKIYKFMLIYQDGTSEVREMNPTIEVIQRRNDTTYNPLDINIFTNVNGKAIAAINVYIEAEGKSGWLREDGSLTGNLNRKNVLVNTRPNLKECSQVIISFIYNN